MGSTPRRDGTRALAVLLFQLIIWLPVSNYAKGWLMLTTIIWDAISFSMMHSYYRVCVSNPPHPLRNDVEQHEILLTSVIGMAAYTWVTLILVSPPTVWQTIVLSTVIHMTTNYYSWVLQWCHYGYIVECTIEDHAATRAAASGYYKKSWKPQNASRFEAVRPFLHAIGYQRYGQSVKAKQRRQKRLKRSAWKR